MEILEKTIKQMPNTFTSNYFNSQAVKNGYPLNALKNKGLSKFIKKYADNMYKGSRTWTLKQTKINLNHNTFFDNIIKNNKPPIGLKPRFIIDEERAKEVKSAIIRYLEAQIFLPIEWVEEYNELIKKK